MRLISQRGATDISYDNYSLSVCGMYGFNRETQNRELKGYEIKAEAYETCFIMGEYSTKEKALKVMEMLQNQYKRFMTTGLIDIKKENIYFKFPVEEDVKESDK
jgi:hypothetical protein